MTSLRNYFGVRRWPRLKPIAPVVLIALLATACSSSEGDPVTTSLTTTTTTSTTLAESATITEAEALAVTDEFFVAFNAGDIERLLALFEPTATFIQPYLGTPTPRADFEEWLAFESGSMLTPSECTTTPNNPGTADPTVRVECVTAHQTFPGVGAPPTEVVHTMNISSIGIRSWEETAGNYNLVRTWFLRWMTQNHPEESPDNFNKWTSVEEARQFGALEAQRVAEWAAYLQANGCDYDTVNC